MRWQLPVSLRVVLFAVFFPSLFGFHDLQFASARIAQLFNGQQYSQGLIIIDSPSQNSQYTAPGSIAISVDVSGNGAVSKTSSATRLTSLEIYLVSATFNVNATVSGPDSDLLDGESGSTVKHVTYSLAQCLASGAYNLTFYEAGVSSNEAYFTITAIPLTIKSNTTSSNFSCVSPPVTTAQPQPQADNALAKSPFLANNVVTTTSESSSSSTKSASTSSSTASTTSSDRSTATFTETRPTTSKSSGSTTGFNSPASSSDSGSSSSTNSSSPTTSSTDGGTGTSATGNSTSSGSGTGAGNNSTDSGTGPGSGSGDPSQIPMMGNISSCGGLLIPVLAESDSDAATTTALGRSSPVYLSLMVFVIAFVL